MFINHCHCIIVFSCLKYIKNSLKVSLKYWFKKYSKKYKNKLQKEKSVDICSKTTKENIKNKLQKEKKNVDTSQRKF